MFNNQNYDVKCQSLYANAFGFNLVSLFKTPKLVIAIKTL